MVTLSQKEFQRVKVIENAAGGRLSVREPPAAPRVQIRTVSARNGWLELVTPFAIPSLNLPASKDSSAILASHLHNRQP